MLKNIQSFAATLAKDEDGTALIEYAILLGIIAVATITTVISIGGWTSGMFKTFCLSVNGKGGQACSPG